MDFVSGNLGWIEAICGPMFSGKSEELMRRLRRAMIARKRVQVFKPIIDNRYSDDEIVSHTDQRMKSEAINRASEVLTRLDWRTQVVGIDESNFMGPGLVDVAQRLADSGSLRELDTQADVASLKQQIADAQLKAVLAQLEVGNGASAGPNAQPQLTPKAEQLARIDERQKYQEALDASLELAKARLGLLRALGHMDDWLHELHTK